MGDFFRRYRKGLVVGGIIGAMVSFVLGVTYFYFPFWEPVLALNDKYWGVPFVALGALVGAWRMGWRPW